MYLVIIIVAAVFFVFGRWSVRNPNAVAPTTDSELDEMREEAHHALSERTSDRKEKLVAMIKRDCGAKGATRNEVEALLGVSDRTAGRYLRDLESEGRIKRIETPGVEVRYIIS